MKKSKNLSTYVIVLITVMAIVVSFIGCDAGIASTGIGASTIDIGGAGDFVILAKTAITTTGDTAITGNIGLSPSARGDLGNFSEALSVDGTYATSIYVVGGGKIYASDLASPTPAKLTTAVSAMESAYTNAAGRTIPDFVNHSSGTLSGLTLAPGLYKWGTSVNITADITISGTPTDTWIFQISGDLIVGSAVKVTLTGGAVAENIVWQVAGLARLGTTSEMAGIILSQTQIILETGSTIKGRLLAQTQVTLDAATVSL